VIGLASAGIPGHAIEGVFMSKGQNGNKEAKKPKKAPAPVAPAGPIPGLPTLGASLAARNKRK
jgi:hypothetical protein